MGQELLTGGFARVDGMLACEGVSLERVADIVGTLVQLGVLYGTGRSLLHALDPSTRALALFGGGTLLLALTGPAIVVRAAARRRTATNLHKRLAAAAVGG